ncbi:cytochrome P450 [Sphingomonas histidinilytica]|jgi:cytochrome P450|uniref:Cytochrome P450 n=1 Tax=Rhizorhabdus histidinilytica TaxID=439228 RepID=A0A1T5FSP4_9SPHN|nr:cytochrome P450 [Rhizorhabdus histidinilytica]MBO9377050.1 cytochrome P450 [Rhizorhabdus histidinilytica]QEH80086.1 cytochrome P450 [Sphingomonas sp. C8-2]SKB99198.1 Cytochrome P450 [Rhizorhabdus histidinilytica]
MAEIEVQSFGGCVHALRQADLRQSLYDEAALMMGRAVVNLHGAEHRARRGVEAVMFRKDIFLHYEKNVLPQTLAETLAPFLAEGRGDLVEIGYRIMMNLTIDFTGVDRPLRSAEETGELLRLLKEFSLAPALGQARDPADVADKKRRIALAMEEFRTRFLDPSLARRQALIDRCKAGEIDRGELPKDVLTALLLGRDELGMSDAEFVQEGIFFVLAGAHTTIHSLTHAVHEIWNWLTAHPEDVERIRSDPYFIQQCVYESLRLHPSSPVARRRALCPVTLKDGEIVEAGQEVAVNLRTANHDVELFGDDANRFNPHRTVRSNFRYGLSMGDGVHACLGRHLAIGVDPKPGSDPDKHQYGVVPLIVAGLLRQGLRPDPDDAPEKDETITRITWARYPIIFKPEEALL